LIAPTTLLTEGLEPEVHTAFEGALAALIGLGHEVQVRALDLLAEAPALYQRYGSFAAHEAWTIYQRELTERGQEMDPRVTHRMTERADSPSSDYIRLRHGMLDLRRRFWPGLV